MAISLQKGQKIDLTKGNEGLSKLMVGLGWDPVKKKGFFGFGGGPDVDCDASVIMLQNDRFVQKDDLVYFGNKTSPCGSVRHSGDNLTGEGAGDDEVILVDLSRVPGRINRLVFVVNIYDAVARRQDFGLVNNAYIRVLNGASKQELVRFNLTDNFANKLTLITGEIYRQDNEWKFAAIGEGTAAASLSEIVKQYH